MWALLISLAVGPGMVLLHAVYVADHYEKEPVRNLLRYVLAGAFVGVVAGVIEIALSKSLLPRVEGASELVQWLMLLPSAYIGVALVEECAKRWAVHLCGSRDPHISEPFDWLVYSVAVSLGFATLENLLYVWAGGFTTAIGRAITAVPAHAFNGTLMGSRLALAEVAQKSGDFRAAARQRRWAVLEPTLWHGTYDLFVFGGQLAYQHERTQLGNGCMGALTALVVIQWIVGFLRVRAQQHVTAKAHLEPPILFPTIRPRLWRRKT